ncbi:MAG TPA: nitrate- and nitrite sensing domain-containing protein [Acidimicrobiales bacterium]
MRRTPIRMKLAAALAVPLLGLLLVTVVEVVGTHRDVDRVRTQTALARASIGPSGLITGLQDERTWAVVELVGQESAVQPPVVGYDASRAATDDAIAAFRGTLAGAGAAAAPAYRDALANLDGLAALRERIDAHTGPRTMGSVGFSDEVYAAYAGLIRPFLDANTRVTLGVDDARLRQVATLIDITGRQLETLSDLARGTILGMVGGGLSEPGEISSLAKLKAVFEDANASLLRAAAPYDELVDAAFPAEMVDAFTAAVEAALVGDEDVEFGAVMGALDVPPDAGFLGLRNALVDALNERADELNGAAEARERLFVAIAALTLAVAVTLTWIVSRSITRPLRSLTRQAKDMADRRLPDAVSHILETPLGEDITVPHVPPVRVRTRDEVADVADALNTVQDTALDLAVEQAVLRRNIADSFVNLGRRNQNLLGRQLDFITELEANEADPDTLADLFRLDHLATRMRRNAESLLVLAGFEPPRQWAAPVRLTDVIRAALGEVESYQRVRVRDAEQATIVGSAAADLAHLMAELIENALVFSPPDQTVEIRGRQRSDGGYTLAVIDSGLGMGEADIAAANRRLAGVESFTIAPSKYLGHYVAGNLAARHGIDVRLDNSPGSGITATLVLPPSLLTDETVTSAPITPPGGHRLRPAAPAPTLAAAGARAAVPPPATPRPSPVLPPAATAPPGRTARPAGVGSPDRRPGERGIPSPPPVGRRPAPVDDGALLAALGRYGGPGGTRASGPRTGPTPVVAGSPAAGPDRRPGQPPGAGIPPPGPLTPRVRGAQMPPTAVVPLRNGADPRAGGRATTSRPAGTGGPTAQGLDRAADVHRLLTSFTVGVQRGLAEARRAGR